MTSRTTIMTVILAVLCAAASVATQSRSAPLTGTWALTIKSGDSTGTPTVTFKQQDEALTGQYSSTLYGEAELKGTVKGTAITFTVFATLSGKRQDLTFLGEYDGSRAIKGEYSTNFGNGTFTGVRK